MLPLGKAQDGTLVILVGSSDEDYMLAKPIFNVLGKVSIPVVNLGCKFSQISY
jgi:3-hydroxyisobutyrate dehydrogenase-like beta-hydroxyacid dehydrogenase